MKNTLFSIVLLAAALTACTKDLSGSRSDGTDGIQTAGTFNKSFSAYCPGGDDATKTVLREDKSVAFQSKDAISVFDVTLGDAPESCSAENVRFNMQGEPAEDGSATFSGTIKNESASYMAVYPYQEDASLEVSKFMQGVPVNYTVYASIPAEQRATPDSFDPAANVSVAKSQKSDNGDVLHFKNLCSLVKFRIPEGESYCKIVFKANDSITDLCGTSAVATSINGPEGTDFTFSGIMEDGLPYVTLSGEITSGHWYYIAVNPCTLQSGFSIDMYDTDTHHCTKTHSGKVSLKRSDILNIGEISGDWLGEGTASKPYRIASYPQLKLLAQLFSTNEIAENWKGKYYLQTNDIDCRGEYIHIGGLDESYVNKEKEVFFEGVYEGDNHTISNFKLKGQEDILYATQYYGLFSRVKNSAFYDINLKPASIFENPTENMVDLNNFYIGTLIAMADSGSKDGPGIVVQNCHVSSDEQFVFTPKAASTVFGGLVGYCCEKMEMTGCSNDMDILVYNDRGEVNGAGLIGVLSAPLTILDYDVISKIDRCRNTGDIKVEDTGGSRQSVAGGLVAMTFDTPTQDLTLQMSSCVNSGNVKASSDNGYSYAAGFIAFQDSDGDYGYDPYLYNCLNTGNIDAEGGDGSLSGKTGTFAGGLGGYIYDDDTHFALCANTGKITISGDEYIGAISASNGSCLWCYWLNAKSHTEEGATPALPCAKCGTTTNCYYYKSLGKDTLNNRRLGKDGQGGTDVVLDKSNTYWDPLQWMLAGAWTGSSTFGGADNSLDIDFDARPE